MGYEQVVEYGFGAGSIGMPPVHMKSDCAERTMPPVLLELDVLGRSHETLRVMIEELAERLSIVLRPDELNATTNGGSDKQIEREPSVSVQRLRAEVQRVREIELRVGSILRRLDV